jgi:thiamine biosynthesis lipoprotein
MAQATVQYALVQRDERLMATDVSVRLAAAPGQEAVARAAADTCMRFLHEVDACLSRFRLESDLCQLNAVAGDWFAASEMLFAAVDVAVRAAYASDGLFDPALLSSIEALGYDRDFDDIAHREVDDGAAPVPGATGALWRDIALDPAQCRVRLPVGARLDLGGIAKGWAADAALERFCTPFPGALVSVGGDLRLRGGPQPGEGWSVGLRDPLREGEGEAPLPIYRASVTLSRGGLATSGAVRRWWLRDGQRVHHLLDPRTGLPAALWTGPDGPALDDAGNPHIATATALAPTAARAEVAAKVALLRGYPAALRAVEVCWERHGALGPSTDADSGVALVLLLATGEVAVSANADEYLQTWGTDGAALSLRVAASE